jgi:hypothetical protein
MEHRFFGKPDEEFSVLSLSLDSRGTYEKALIWDDEKQLEKATVDAIYCGELSYWTDSPIPQLLKSQAPLADAWIKGWSRGEQINIDHALPESLSWVAGWQAV